MALIKGTVNGVPCVVDDAATTVPIVDVTGDGGDVIAGVAGHVATARSPIVVDTVAAMQALAAPYLIYGQTYQTLGYYAARDGGENLYQYDSGSSATVDGGLVINGPSGTGRYLAMDQGPVIHTAKWGVVCDGSTDNGDQLVNMGLAMAADPDTHWEVHFDPGSGSCDYTKNWWLFNVNKVTVDGHGVWLRNTRDDPWSVASRTLNNGRWDYASYSETNFRGTSATSGHLIDTVEAGVSIVMLATVGDGDNYSAGDRVLLHGFLHQVGTNPPNMRFFEWNVISSVAGDEITLASPTKHKYRADWRDESTGWGAARIMNLGHNSSRCYPQYIELKNVHVAQGPAAAIREHQNGFGIDSEVAVFRNVTGIDDCWPSGIRSVLWENCEMDDSDLDKVVGQCVFRNCDFAQGIVAGTGIELLSFEDCRITAGMTVAPRTLHCYRNSINMAGGANGCIGVYGAWHSEKVVIDSNTIVGAAAANYIYNGGTLSTLTVDGVGAGGEILLAAGSGATMFKIGRGTYFWNTSGFTGRVSDFWWDGTNYVIQGTWSGTPTGTLNFLSVSEVIARNNTWDSSAKFWRQLTVPAISLVEKETVGNYTYDSKGLPITGGIGKVGFAMEAKLLRAKVHIIKPYTGSDGSPYLRFYVDFSKRLDVPLTGVGVYELTRSGTSYSGTTPTLIHPIDADWDTAAELQLYLRSGAAQLTGTAAEMPHVVIEMQFVAHDYQFAVPYDATAPETITATTATLSTRQPSQLDSTANAITATLGSGDFIGQIKTVVMTNATNASTLVVTNHETADGEIFTFDAVDEYVTLVWTGTEWATLGATATV